MSESAASVALRVPQPITSLSPSNVPPKNVDTALDSHELFRQKYSRTGGKPSSAKSEENTKGIYSHDPILDQNPGELWLFLLSNLRAPRMAVTVEGSHTIPVYTDEGVQNETVIDFSIEIDVSKYMIPEWDRIFVRPSSSSSSTRSKPVPSLRETLEQYTRSRNPFKAFRLEKGVLWEHARVRHLLEKLVSSTGYGGTIKVYFPMSYHKVVALAPNRSSGAAHCVVSCLWRGLWIVCCPAWCMATKHIQRLTCHYRMAVTGDEFFSRNSAQIHSAVARAVDRKTLWSFVAS